MLESYMTPSTNKTEDTKSFKGHTAVDQLPSQEGIAAQ